MLKINLLKMPHIIVHYMPLTANILYIYKKDGLIKEIIFEAAIDMYIDNLIIILESNGNVFLIEPQTHEKLLLFTNGVELKGNGILLSTGETICEIKLSDESELTYDFIRIPIDCDRFLNLSSFGIYVLNDGKLVFWIKENGIEPEYHDYNGTKDICGNWMNIFLII